MTKRKCDDWLMSLLDYVEETESPRKFWLWGGISTLASALQRKVWVPFGLGTIYPNLYVMLVAVPGECRKGAPLEFSKKILDAIGVSVFADSPTKRALTRSLDKVRRHQNFQMPGSPAPIMHSSMSLVSKEFSSLLAVDPKAMIEILTDLYDSHDEWIYQTDGAGTDKLFRLCLNCFIGTTPDWIANNLPEEAIGGGFTTRVVLVSAKEKYKWISLPPPPPEKLYVNLKHDLKRINQIVIGEFKWGKGAYRFYDDWYMAIPERTRKLRDQRLRGNLSRIHVMTLKTAMCLHVAYSDELILEIKDLEKSMAILDDSLKHAGEALSGHGRSRTAVDVEKVSRQLKIYGEIMFKDLLMLNYHDTNKPELIEVLQTIEAMETIRMETSVDGYGNTKIGRIWWIGAKEGGRGKGGVAREPLQFKKEGGDAL